MKTKYETMIKQLWSFLEEVRKERGNVCEGEVMEAGRDGGERSIMGDLEVNS